MKSATKGNGIGGREEIIRDLRSTKNSLAQAYNGFDFACDSDLISSYIYEIKALQSRYDYLIKQLKSMEGG